MTELTLQQCHELCLYTEVRIKTPAALGSGTVVYQEPTPGEEGMFDTYVLTNEHVVDNLISIKKKWDTVLKREVKVDVVGHPEVHVFNFSYKSRVTGASAFMADIVCYDKEEDLALLRVRSTTEFKHVAQMYPEDEINKLIAFMPVWNVGCGLGGIPAITDGRLSGFGIDIDNKDFFLVTAPSIFGNSGGATFLAETGEYIGVPARISTYPFGWGADVATHLGYSIPISRIYNFLRDQVFDFIFTEKTSEQCEKEREERRKADLYRRERREEKGESEE